MERNDQDWKTIVTHMRVRANLSKSEARAIVAYIQMTNMPEPTLSSHGTPSKLLASAQAGDSERRAQTVDVDRSDEVVAKEDPSENQNQP